MPPVVDDWSPAFVTGTICHQDLLDGPAGKLSGRLRLNRPYHLTATAIEFPNAGADNRRRSGQILYFFPRWTRGIWPVRRGLATVIRRPNGPCCRNHSLPILQNKNKS